MVRQSVGQASRHAGSARRAMRKALSPPPSNSRNSGSLMVNSILSKKCSPSVTVVAPNRLLSCQNYNGAFSQEMLSSSSRYWRTNGSKLRCMSTVRWREDMIRSEVAQEQSPSQSRSDDTNMNLMPSTAVQSLLLTDPRKAFPESMVTSSVNYWRNAGGCTHSVNDAENQTPDSS
jgi:hypothetical protein